MAPLNRSPSSSKPTIIRHFTDPKHPLHLLNIPSEFLCNGCSALGFGTRYRCHACDVDLHDFCAMCPSASHSALHPKHPLTLVNKPVNDRFCDLCGDLVHGLFYSCEACEFDVHPLCTQLPLHVRLPQHSQHLLKLQPAKPAACALCYDSCTSWRYRCEPCSLDIHLECVFARDGAQTPPEPPPHLKRTASAPPLLPPQQHHQQQMGYGGCAVGVPLGSGGGYNVNGMASPEMMMMLMNNHLPPPTMMMNNHNQTPMMMMMNNQQQQPIMMMDNQQQQQQQPAAAKAGGKTSNGSKKRKIYSIVARLAISAVTTSLIGVPLAL